MLVRTIAYYYFAYGSIVQRTKRTPGIPAYFTTHPIQYVHVFIMALWVVGVISYHITLDYIYPCIFRFLHYSEVIMGMMASEINGVSIVCSTVCSGSDQRNLQSPASLAFVRGIHRSPVDSPHKEPVTRQMFPFHDVTMSLGMGQNRPIYIHSKAL